MTPGSSGIRQAAVSLRSIVVSGDSLRSVKKSDLRPGDYVCIETRNSRYELRVLGNGKYAVSGGWFDRKGKSPAIMTIAGCTWGGSVIKVDIVAACGLSLEFGNRLITSTIQKVFVLPQASQN
jgi:hypothetical protein